MSPVPTDRPLRTCWLGVALVGAVTISVTALPWDLSHLATAEGWQAAWSRLGAFAAGFAPPDLSAATLRRAADLALETVAVAVLGVALGVLLAYPLAVLASDATLDDGSARRGVRRSSRVAVREGARLALDALRGVPDFVWALVLLTVFGPNAVTAVLAIAVHVAGTVSYTHLTLPTNREV